MTWRLADPSPETRKILNLMLNLGKYRLTHAQGKHSTWLSITSMMKIECQLADFFEPQVVVITLFGIVFNPACKAKKPDHSHCLMLFSKTCAQYPHGREMADWITSKEMLAVFNSTLDSIIRNAK